MEPELLHYTFSFTSFFSDKPHEVFAKDVKEIQVEVKKKHSEERYQTQAQTHTQTQTQTQIQTQPQSQPQSQTQTQTQTKSRSSTLSRESERSIKGTKSSSLILAGFVMCITDESEDGYFLGCIESFVPSDNGETIFQLALLVVDKSSAFEPGKIGCQYTIKEIEGKKSYFWETEAQLLPLDMEQIKSQDEKIVYVLKQQIPEFAISDVMSACSSFTDTRAHSISESFFKFQVYSISDLEEIQLQGIDSPEQLDNICREIHNRVLEKSKLQPDSTPICVNNGIQVFMKPSPKDFHHFIAECDVPSSSCEIYLKLLTAKNRKSFDPFNEDVSVVQTMNESTSIISLTESPIIRFFGLFQREFLLLTHGRSIDDKCYVISMNSILDVPIIDDDETDRNIPSPDIIRGLIIDSGWIIQQKSKGLSRLTYVIQVDFGGWVPAFVIRSQLEEQVVELLSRICKLFQATPA